MEASKATPHATALVAGAGGIIGRALLEEITRMPDWHGLALSRQGGDVSADLTEATATCRALEAAQETTHLFYAAYKPGGGLTEEDCVNAAMLHNLLDGLAAVGAPLERVVLYQGAKVYGVHPGPVRSPFYEDDDFTQPGILVREVFNDDQHTKLVDQVAGSLLGGVREPVLSRAFAYWKNIDADIGRRVEDKVRRGAATEPVEGMGEG